jgi:acyl-CoA thioesterase
MTNGLIAEFKRLVPTSPEASSENALGRTSWGERLGSDADRQAAAKIHAEAKVNVKATLSPDDLARACADAMWQDDDAGKGLGMEILQIKAGEAVLTMTVKPNMVNGHGVAHGGFIFTLADSAFAFACNSHNERAVTAQCNISFIRPGKLGDLLIATAREISRTGRSGIYDVRVTVDDTAIAELRGHSRTVGGAWVPSVEPDAKLK